MIVAGALGALLALEPVAAAQVDVHVPEPAASTQRKARMHDGFYLRMSAGGLWGGTSVAGDTPGDPTHTIDGFGLAVDAMAGGTVSGPLALGGAVAYQSFGQGRGSGTATLVTFGMFVDGFPMPNGGLHLGGMLGTSFSSTSAYADDTAFRGMGPGIAAWLGYDGWVADEWALGGMLKLGGGIAWGGPDEAGPAEVQSAATYEMTLLFSVLYH